MRILFFFFFKDFQGVRKDIYGCTFAVNTLVGELTRLVTCLRNKLIPVWTEFVLFSRRYYRMKQRKQVNIKFKLVSILCNCHTPNKVTGHKLHCMPTYHDITTDCCSNIAITDTSR